jgi:hypothetical protein
MGRFRGRIRGRFLLFICGKNLPLPMEKLYCRKLDRAKNLPRISPHGETTYCRKSQLNLRYWRNKPFPIADLSLEPKFWSKRCTGRLTPFSVPVSASFPQQRFLPGCFSGVWNYDFRTFVPASLIVRMTWTLHYDTNGTSILSKVAETCSGSGQFVRAKLSFFHFGRKIPRFSFNSFNVGGWIKWGNGTTLDNTVESVTVYALPLFRARILTLYSSGLYCSILMTRHVSSHYTPVDFYCSILMTRHVSSHYTPMDFYCSIVMTHHVSSHYTPGDFYCSILMTCLPPLTYPHTILQWTFRL